ncbi:MULTISPECIES: hypothetical protein [Cupriavidus]
MGSRAAPVSGASHLASYRGASQPDADAGPDGFDLPATNLDQSFPWKNLSGAIAMTTRVPPDAAQGNLIAFARNTN